MVCPPSQGKSWLFFKSLKLKVLSSKTLKPKTSNLPQALSLPMEWWFSETNIPTTPQLLDLPKRALAPGGNSLKPKKTPL